MLTVHAVDSVESCRNMQRIVGPTRSFIVVSWTFPQSYDGWTIFLGLQNETRRSGLGM